MSGVQAGVSNVKGIARFVDAQQYAASFGFQWHRYQKTQLDHDEVRESDRHFGSRPSLRPEELKGKARSRCGLRHGALRRSGDAVGSARGWN